MSAGERRRRAECQPADQRTYRTIADATHSRFPNADAPQCFKTISVPPQIADQIDFLRDAAQRMKRVRDVIRTISMAAMERQGGQPDFLDRLHVFAKILSCELVTALRAAGDESKVDGCTETGSQDRLVEYLVVREFIDLLKHVIAGTKVLKQLSASAAVVEASAPPLPFM